MYVHVSLVYLLIVLQIYSQDWYSWAIELCFSFWEPSICCYCCLMIPFLLECDESKNNLFCVSLMAKNIEYFFKYLLATCIYSFRKYLFSSLAHLLIRWFGLWSVLNRHLSHMSWVWNGTSLIWVFNFLRYLWVLDNQMHTWKRLFSHSVGSPYSGGWFLCYTKCFFNLM